MSKTAVGHQAIEDASHRPRAYHYGMDHGLPRVLRTLAMTKTQSSSTSTASFCTRILSIRRLSISTTSNLQFWSEK